MSDDALAETLAGVGEDIYNLDLVLRVCRRREYRSSDSLKCAMQHIVAAKGCLQDDAALMRGVQQRRLCLGPFPIRELAESMAHHAATEYGVNFSTKGD